MKSIKIMFFSLLLYSCGKIGAGSMGAYEISVFPITQERLTVAIDSLLSDSPQYIVPKKWKYESEYWERDTPSVKSVLLYFKNNKEEIFYIKFLDPGFVNDPENSRIALIAVYHEYGGWKEIRKFSDEERKRLQKRFNDEFIIKLEKLTSTKSWFQKTYP